MEGLIFGILRYTVRDTQQASRDNCMGHKLLSYLGISVDCIAG